MTRHEFLAALHRQLKPRNYLEIGVNDGRSLALSRVPSIGVDPKFKIKVKITCDAQLVKATSDAFFERPDPLSHLRAARSSRSGLGRRLWPCLSGSRRSGGRDLDPPTLDFTFIDGMHWFEYALRDFMNVERHAARTSVIVFDDMLPRSVEEAARDRTTKFWTGDVFKVLGILRTHRPELLAIPVDTQPTGLLVVLMPDPRNTVLRDGYDAIVAANTVPDPQPVPDTILRRDDAVNPEAFLASGVWSTIIGARGLDESEFDLNATIRRMLDGVVATSATRSSAATGPVEDPVSSSRTPGETATM